jgi:hypothetical protein
LTCNSSCHSANGYDCDSLDGAEISGLEECNFKTS